MSNSQVRWGVLSTSNIGRRAVIPAIQASHNGRVVALASRDQARAAAMAAELGIARAYGSYAELLADPDVDAVYIPLPNSLHREWTIKAAEAGKHILCEKPLALDAAECRAMADAAAANGVLLMEAFMYRYHPQTAAVQELLASGGIGEPRLIHAAFSFNVANPANIRLQPELGGGALMDVGCYCVNVSRTLFAAEPESVQAWARWSPGGVDEQMVATLQFADGRYAQFDCALTLARRESYEVVGTGGQLVVPVAFLPGAGDTTLQLQQAGAATVARTVPGADEYQLMVEDFAAAVVDGRPVRYPPAEAAANMRVIEALYRSARSGGRPEPVPTA